MEQSAQTQKVIDLKKIWQVNIAHRKAFYWAIPITFVISAAIILCVPRYYTCRVTLAPEAQNGLNNSSLGAIASGFGFNLGESMSEDAIYPSLYPDVVKSTDFMAGLFNVEVTTGDGTYSGTYFQYLTTQYKRPFWQDAKRGFKRWLRKIKPKSKYKRPTDSGKSINTFWLNDLQTSTIALMRKHITCNVDKRTDVITLSVTAQDPYIAATMVDSVRCHLQAFMTAYRTKKARSDMEYYTLLMKEAYQEYTKAKEVFVSYSDSHTDLQREAYKIEASNLQEEMDLRYSVYSSYQKQFMAAQMKLQESTPIYTTLQGATVPNFPAGPRRGVFVILMCFLVTFGMIMWFSKDVIMG